MDVQDLNEVSTDAAFGGSKGTVSPLDEDERLNSLLRLSWGWEEDVVAHCSNLARMVQSSPLCFGRCGVV